MPADLHAALTRKLGPLPLWQWLVAGVGGVALAQGLKRVGAGTNTETPASPADASNASSGFGYGLPPTAGSGAIYAPDNSAATQPPAIASNDAWLVRASATLIAKGYSALLVHTALRKYLEGDALAPNERAVVELALQTVGIPPEHVPLPPPPIPAPPSTPKPKPGTGPAPATQTISQSSPRKPAPAGVFRYALEVPVDFANGPHGGTWWVSNYGGVAAVGEPYKGSAFDLAGGVSAVHNAATDKPFVAIEPSGSGYVLIRADGKRVTSRP